MNDRFESAGSKKTVTRYAGVTVAMLLVASGASAQLPFAQEGAKLVGSGAAGLASQGSVAISADGNTALLGGPVDHSPSGGAVWVFVRTEAGWAQQGTKLLPTGATSGGDFGRSVALSADGNTAIIGDWADNANTGAVFVFTRSHGAWSQLGNKLLADDATVNGHVGWTVAISADGNTLIAGGNNDNAAAGAAWIFTRNGNAWSQQGQKLFGIGAVGGAHQGNSVAISADGNTAIVGGVLDNSVIGAVWVFARSGSSWTQQGGKLVANDEVGAAALGQSVAISADGNTAIVGGLDDDSKVGAAWIFTRDAGVWSQKGGKLVGAGAVGNATQGTSVSISANGDLAVVSGDQDNSAAGALWVFHECFGDWTQQGAKLVGSGQATPPALGASVAISGDGSTIIAGGPNDAETAGHAAGAAWVFAADFPPFGVIPVCGPSLAATPPHARP